MDISPQWLADFFDGEGCINITVAGKHRRCILRLYLVNTAQQLLRDIRAQYGGQLTIRPNKKNPTWKPYCALIWTNKQAVSLIGQIEELLILKRPQLKLAQRFLALRDAPDRYESSSVVGIPRTDKTFRYRIRQETLDMEAWLKSQMHILNRKGQEASDAIQRSI